MLQVYVDTPCSSDYRKCILMSLAHNLHVTWFLCTMCTAANCVQNSPEKNIDSLMHYHFVAVRYRITQYAPKCSANITVFHLVSAI